MAALGDRIELSYYDPLVSSIDGDEVCALEDAVRDADVVAILTDHPALQGLPPSTVLETTARPLLVIDAWHGLADIQEVASTRDVDLVRLGDGTVERYRHA